MKCKHIWEVEKDETKRACVSMLLIPFDISSLTSHTWELYAPEMATKSKLSTWPESKKKMWKKKKSRVWYVLSRQVDFMSIHCIICVFKLIIRHWSNIRKWGERGAKASNQNPREKKNIEQITTKPTSMSFIRCRIRLYCIWNINVILGRETAYHRAKWVKVKGKVKMIFTILSGLRLTAFEASSIPKCIYCVCTHEFTLEFRNDVEIHASTNTMIRCGFGQY